MRTLKSTISMGLALLAIPAMASAALADVITLKDGRIIEGAVTESNGKLTVKGRYGAIHVPADQVVRWERSETPLQEFERKKAALTNGGTADERYRLGTWARDKGLLNQAKDAFQSVLSLDPDHPGARAALGFVLENGTWITIEDRNRLRGLVKYKGRWITLEEKARLLKEQEEKDAAEDAAREAKKEERRLRRRLAAERARRRRAEEALAANRPSLGFQRIPRSRSGRISLLESFYGGYGFSSATGFGLPFDFFSSPFIRYFGVGSQLTNRQILLLIGAARRGIALPGGVSNPFNPLRVPPEFGRNQGPRRGTTRQNPVFVPPNTNRPQFTPPRGTTTKGIPKRPNIYNQPRPRPQPRNLPRSLPNNPRRNNNP